MRRNFFVLNILPFILAIGLFYFTLAYQMVRSDFIKLFTLYTAVFLLSYIFWKKNKSNFGLLTAAGLLFRLLFLVALPSLSQDFYRFLWDGRLIASGINPYLFTPDELITQSGFILEEAATLHEKMGALSAKNYSNYPPLNQYFFSFSGYLFPNNLYGAVIFMRLLIVLADLGTLYFGRRLLQHLKIPQERIFLYYLNPLIIIEFTGNLHFEGVMVFFLCFSLWLLSKSRILTSAIAYACSISLKLIPLIFLTLFLKKLGWKKSLVFFAIVGLVNLFLFLPFYNAQFFDHYLQTLGLWFTNFEFNASIYNLIKFIGYQITGYNTIQTTGRFMPFVVIAMVLFFSFYKRRSTLDSLILSMLWVLSCYFMLSTTVHPWYLGTLVILAVFSNWNFPLVWSFTVILSYQAYAHPLFKENYYLLTLEYLAVFGVLFYELRRKRYDNNRIT